MSFFLLFEINTVPHISPNVAFSDLVQKVRVSSGRQCKSQSGVVTKFREMKCGAELWHFVAMGGDQHIIRSFWDAAVNVESG